MAISNPDQRAYLGEHDQIVACRVVLRIIADDLDPKEISTALDLEPTKAWRKDEAYVSKAGGTYTRPIGLWQLSSFKNPSKSLENHCMWLLSTLRGRVGALRELKKSGRFRISVILSWNTGGPVPGGYNLRSSTMKSMTTLCDDIEFHFL